MGHTVCPSVKASTDTSGPVRKLSMTTRLPESPKTLSSIMSRMAARASSRFWQISTPLPRARPSALMTWGKAAPSRYRRASSARVKTS